MARVLTDPLFWFFAVPCIVAILLAASLLYRQGSLFHPFASSLPTGKHLPPRPLYLACAHCGVPVARGPVSLDTLLAITSPGESSLEWHGDPCTYCGCRTRAWRWSHSYWLRLALYHLCCLIRRCWLHGRSRARFIIAPDGKPNWYIKTSTALPGLERRPAPRLTKDDKIALAILLPIALYYFVACAPAIITLAIGWKHLPGQ